MRVQYEPGSNTSLVTRLGLSLLSGPLTNYAIIHHSNLKVTRNVLNAIIATTGPISLLTNVQCQKFSNAPVLHN